MIEFACLMPMIEFCALTPMIELCVFNADDRFLGEKSDIMEQTDPISE
jgi:hypothetical protein